MRRRRNNEERYCEAITVLVEGMAAACTHTSGSGGGAADAAADAAAKLFRKHVGVALVKLPTPRSTESPVYSVVAGMHTAAAELGLLLPKTSCEPQVHR